MTPVLETSVLEELAPAALLAFDFDGTLAPITQRPEEAAMRPTTAALLARVAAARPTAILTGRARSDALVRLDGAPVGWVIGQHGDEGAGPPAEALGPAREAWSALLPLHPGAELEDKGRSLSLHYRGAASPAATRRAGLAAIHDLPGLRVIAGKMVLNVVSASAPHKGDALARLVREAGVERALFVGDDVTDEDVFRAAPPAWVTVRVGRSTRTAARYYLRSQTDIDALLTRLLA